MPATKCSTQRIEQNSASFPDICQTWVEQNFSTGRVAFIKYEYTVSIPEEPATKPFKENVGITALYTHTCILKCTRSLNSFMNKAHQLKTYISASSLSELGGIRGKPRSLRIQNSSFHSYLRILLGTSASSELQQKDCWCFLFIILPLPKVCTLAAFRLFSIL